VRARQTGKECVMWIFFTPASWDSIIRFVVNILWGT